MLREGEGFKVKTILVRPGKRLSLQYHDHREERWTVVRGRAAVLTARLDELDCASERELALGECVSIARGEVHRLANPGDEELEIIEVQLGDTLSEDDIHRIADDFGRCETIGDFVPPGA